MRTAIIAVTTLLLATKLADCLTTLRYVRSSAGESNPIAAPLMRRFGFSAVVWGIGALAACIILAASSAALHAGALWYRAGFLVIGTFVSLVQADVARANASRRLGFFARRAASLHQWIHGRLS